MLPFSKFALFASIVTCAITDSPGKHYPDVVYVYDKCNQSITVAGDVRIQLTTIKYLSTNIECSITFHTNDEDELTGKFLSYSMNPSYTHESGLCPYESIQLYDAAGTPQLSKEEDYCKTERPKDIYYLDNSGRFRFNIGRFNHTLTANVDLLISEITPKEDFDKSICPSSYFDCENGYCVAENITCNGYDDCGDNVDETRGCGHYNKWPVTVGAIVIFAIGFILVVFQSFCICMLLWKIRNRQYQKF